ncbi:MAG: sulfite exporter TauE/SafE family protein [Campylobacterales bacterium]|nr:sulfite exporter TauE/SafE family protein [Campylobacterales bacterium]
MILELIISGFLVGMFSGFFGVGGGTFLVPLLVFLGFGFKEAIGISVMQMVFGSIFGSYLNKKNGSLILSDGKFIGIGGFFGAILSGFCLEFLPTKLLATLFLLFVAFAIYRLFNHGKKVYKIYNPSYVILIIIGVIMGFFAISIGAGGSVLLTPLLVGYFGYDVKKASSMGLFFVVFSSIAGFLSLSFNGLIDYYSGFFIGISSLFGVYYGIFLKEKINSTSYKKILILIYVIIFVFSFYKLILK